MTKLDLSNSSSRKLGSETKTTSSCSKCIDARRNQQDRNIVGYSSSEKISCKCGSWWMASAIEVSIGHTHSNTSDVNRHPRKSNKTIKPRRKQLMCRTTRLAQEMTRRKLWIKLNVRLERAKVWRLENPQVNQETTAQSTRTTKQKISSIKRRDRRDDEPSSERDTRKSKFQSQSRKAGTTQVIHEMHKINKEAEPLKCYKLKIKPHEVHKINTEVEPPNGTNQTKDQAALGNQAVPRIYNNDALTELHTQEVAAKWHITQALQQH